MASTNSVREILDLLGIEYSEAGSRVMFLCPLPEHADTRPSTCAYPDEGRFKCFGCEASGDMTDLYAGTRGLTRWQAEDEIARLTGAPPPHHSQPDQKVERHARQVGESALRRLRDVANMREFFVIGERLDKLCFAWRKGLIDEGQCRGALDRFLREIKSWVT